MSVDDQSFDKLRMIICGSVIRGDGRGKKLGFPTINVQSDQKVDQAVHGVWAAFVTLGAKPVLSKTEEKYTKAQYSGIVHIGPPTNL